MANGFAIEALIGEMIRLVADGIRRSGNAVEVGTPANYTEWGSYVQVGLPAEYRALEISRVSELLLVDIATELVKKAIANVPPGATIKTAPWLPNGAQVLDIQTGEGIGMVMGMAPSTGMTGETVIIFGMRHWT